MTAPPPPGAGISEHACARAWAALTAAHARVAASSPPRCQQQCGLTITDFEILLRLDAGHGAGLRIGDLTGAIRLSQPALSRAVARLARPRLADPVRAARPTPAASSSRSPRPAATSWPPPPPCTPA